MDRKQLTILLAVCISLCFAASAECSNLYESSYKFDSGGPLTQLSPDNFNIIHSSLDVRLNIAEGTSDSALQNVVEDLTPQLGGDLDTNSFDINISSGFHLLFGANQIDDGSDKLDGEQIADNTIDEDAIDWGSGAGQVDLADIPGGVAGASVFDYGGATSLEIPNSADVSANVGDGILSWNNVEKTLYMGDGTNAIAIGGGSETLNELHINFVAPATASSVFAAVDVELDVSALVATSDVHALNVAAVGSTSGTIVALGTEPGVEVIHQHTGSFTTPSQTEYAGEIPSGGSWSDGIDGKTVFEADNDEIYIGAAAKFGELEVILSTPCSKDEVLVFEYEHTTGPTWTPFTPIDGTEGFQQSGIIEWASENLTNWKSNSDPGGASASAGYYVRVRRTRNGSATDPIVTTIKLVDPTDFVWNELGDLSIHDLTASGTLLFSDTGVSTHLGDMEYADEKGVIWGTDSNIRSFYNETDDIWNMNTAATASQNVDYGIYTIAVDTGNSGMTANQEVFEIGKGGVDDSDGNYVELLRLDEDGDLHVRGRIVAADGIRAVPGEFATITLAKAAASAGDIIDVEAGTYNEAVNINVAGVILRGRGASTIINGGTTGTALTIAANNVTILNLAVQTTGGGGNAYNAISITSGDDILIDNVTVIDSDNVGISVSATSDRVTLSRIRLIDTDATGILAFDNGSELKIVDSHLAVTGTIAGGNTINIQSDFVVITGNLIGDAATRSLNISATANNVVYDSNYIEGAVADAGTASVAGDNS